MSTTGQSVSILKLISQIKKCSSSQSLYKLLVQIRTDVIREDEGIKLLRDSGGLKHIVKCLSKPNEKVLNVSLSILANCCLQEDCREQVGHEIIGILCRYYLFTIQFLFFVNTLLPLSFK